MARKKTYIYRVEIFDGRGLPVSDFCYARNKAAAIEGMKELYPNQRAYGHFRTYIVGKAPEDIHFRKISGDELAWLRSNRGKLGEKYKEVF